MRTVIKNPASVEEPNVLCAKCIHTVVCKYKDMMLAEQKKLQQTQELTPIRITVTCESFKEVAPTFRNVNRNFSQRDE